MDRVTNHLVGGIQTKEITPGSTLAISKTITPLMQLTQ